MNTTGRLGSLFVLFAVSLTSLGCGEGAPDDRPDLGLVQGSVTMGGKPLSGAMVTFSPEKGRPSAATTDSSGKYELTYVGDTKGAKLGPHKVSITTVQEDSGEEGAATEAKEPIPAKYNVATTLTAEVKDGPNTFDFKLEPGTASSQPASGSAINP